MKLTENTQEKDPALDVNNKESIGTDWRGGVLGIPTDHLRAYL